MKAFCSFLVLVLIVNLDVYSQSGGETCATATIISSIPYTGIGSTSGAIDDYFESCVDVGNQGGANDHVYEYTNGPTDKYVDISLCEAITDYDSQLYVYEGNCTGTPVGCQEDGCQSPSFSAPYNSRITAQLFQANMTYFIVVDGYGGSDNGNYQLNITESIGLNPPSATNIPLVLINTNGQEIIDEPKILVNMKIIDNGPGALNHPTDPANVYDGYAGIEIRGSYSATLPQKPYGVETQDALGQNNNVSLLGMPTENDWILLANYNDKTFLRNILAFDLFNKMGHYAPRTQLCEVVINDIYNGVYVFTEKIKRDNDRVDISRLDLDDNAGDSLTGGYIFKVDYWNGSNSWPSNYDNPNYPGSTVQYVYGYPDEQDITQPQKTYIQGRVSEFEDALWGSNFEHPTDGYRKYIDVLSFIDYFIVNEFARNIDGFKKSRRFHKTRDNKDSLIYAGPVWDFDWAYKDHDASMLNGSGWRHSFSGASDVKPPGWYMRMIQDTVFANQLSCRYFNLRNTILDTSVLFNYIDSLGNVLIDAQDRHFTRWPILGVNVGTPEIGTQPNTYAEEIVKFKGWIAERLNWLDANMPGNCPNVGVATIEKEPYSAMYPNPANDVVNVFVNRPIADVSIVDLSGKVVHQVKGNSSSLVQLNTRDLSGSFLVVVRLETGKILRSKLLIQ
ncbi:MAG: CotH kinase family protein [Crocinitomicaceae bacterium]|nr:CotH kinase family protein [Crocinitomicaceae bacterium]